MVCCDKCDGWYHFSCVGVTETIANVEWVCSSCTSLTDSVARAPPGNHFNLSTVAQAGEYVQPNLTSDVRVAKKTSSQTTSSKNVSKRLLEQMKILEDEEKILRRKEELLNKRKELLKQLGTDSDNEESAGPMRKECRPNAESTKAREFEEHDHSWALNDDAGLSQMRNTINTIMGKMAELELKSNTTREQSSTSQWLPGVFPDVSVQTNPPTPLKNVVRRLTREQIAARSSFAKDLQKFSGNPEDWPLFLASKLQIYAVLAKTKTYFVLEFHKRVTL